MKIRALPLYIIMFIFLCASWASATENIGYINDSCVIDRSCCALITNSLDFVCFRNDTNSSFTNPFEPKDLFSNDVDNALMGYEGSKLTLKQIDIKDYDGFQGVGRANYGKNLMVSKFLTVPASRDNISNTLWGLIGAGSATGGANQRSETYAVPFNEWSFIILTKINCRQAISCNTSNEKSAQIHHKSTLPRYIANVTNLIDGVYHGIRLNYTPTGADQYEQNLVTEWIIAVNDTPDRIMNLSDSDVEFEWNIAFNENISIAAIITIKDYENNISDWFANPVKLINDAINYSTEWQRRLKYPEQLNNSQKKSYYTAKHNYWLNTVKAYPSHEATSQWGNNRVYAPVMATYPATWVWDSFYSCIGMLQSCVNDGSQRSIECLDICKENLEVWVNKSETNKIWNRTVRDKITDSTVSQPNGGWDLVALHLYNRSVISLAELCNSTYPALRNHYLGKNATTRVMSAGVYCSDVSSGDGGWDGSDRYDGNCQIDTTGWHALSAEVLATIAGYCGDTDNQSKFRTDFIYLQNGIKYMWADNESDYCDLDNSNSCMYENGYSNSSSISGASAWAFLVNASNSTTEIQVLNNWENESRLKTFNLIPTIQKKHIHYDPWGATQNWMGVIWPPVNIVAILALEHLGYATNSTYIRDKSIAMVSEAGVVGREAYSANNNTGAPVFAAPSKLSYLWGDALLFTATWGVDLLDLINVNSLIAGGSGAAPTSVDNGTWEERFNWINTNQSDGMGVLHRSTTASSMYTEIPNFIRSYLNMYKATNNPIYLNYSDKHLVNISTRYTEWGTMSNGDFRYGHMGGIYAEFIYEANMSGLSYYQNRGSTYLQFIQQNISPKIDPYYRSFSYNSKTIGALTDGLSTNISTQIKPYNQQYGYALMQMYLCNITGNNTNCDRANKLFLFFNSTISYGNCQYDITKQCVNQSYRINLTMSFENYTGITFGFPPYKEVWNYWSQDSELLYRYWKYGLSDNDTFSKIANSIYFDQYIHEGNLSNVLISEDVGYAGVTFSDNHDFYLTHGTYTIPYFSFVHKNITNVSLAIINFTYSFVNNETDKYNFYRTPYRNITDPRTGLQSNFTDNNGYSNVTSDQLMMYISTYLYDINGYNDQQELFDFTVSGSGATPTSSNSFINTLSNNERALYISLIFLIIFGALYALIKNPMLSFTIVFLGATLAVYLLRGMLGG